MCLQPVACSIPLSSQLKTHDSGYDCIALEPNVKSVVIIPTYNEKDNILPLTKEILCQVQDMEILFVDDASADGSGEVIEQLVCQGWPVTCLHRQGKLGLGSAYREAFKKVLAKKYDYIFTMDADFSHHPKYLPVFWEKLQEFDVVVGSRYVPGGGVTGWPLGRRLLSRWANRYANKVTAIGISDLTSGFMGFRRRVIETLPLAQFNSDDYAFLIELKYFCRKNRWQTGEVPIIFTDRKAGRSKLSSLIALESALLVWKLRWRIKGR